MFLAAVLALAGCSGSDEGPKTLPPLRSTSPTPSPSPNASPSIPAEATARDASGAAAFTRYYFATLANDAYRHRDADSIKAASDEGCKSCSAIASDVARLVSANTTVDGTRFKVLASEAAPPVADGTYIVDFRYASDPYIETDSLGKIVREEPAQLDQDGQMRVTWRGDRWVAVGIRLVNAS